MSTYIASLYILLVGVLLFTLALIVWRTVQTRRAPLALCLFCVLPVSHIFMLYSFSFAEWSMFWLIGLLLGLTAIVALLVYTLLQERMAAHWEEMQETRRRIELEKSYRKAIAQRRQELGIIQSEFAEAIAGITQSVRDGADAEARDSIFAFSTKLNRTKGKTYCAVPVINAVLTQKESDCQQAGIDLVVDLQLPDPLDVRPLHLCSILGNMLDNAIVACRQIPNPDKALIRLTSIIDGDYLLVKVTNPASKPAKKPAPRRPYGLQILAEIAKEYDGDFLGGYRDGTFTAIISLAIR
jgi:signal transduction histidine kinase